MSSAAIYPHISVEPGGSAFLVGTRYKVIHLAGEHYHYGWSAEELLRQHPDLKPEQVYSALTFFYDHYDEIISQLEQGQQSAEIQRMRQSLSRDEILKRANLRRL
jgi:uncharacterized protein (DUF433 family)